MTSTQQPDTVTALSPAQRLFPDLDSELATTRRVLERVPDDRLEWGPHAKSMTLGRLATHLAELPRLATLVATLPEFNFDPASFKSVTLGSTAEIVALFDETSAALRQGIQSLDWEQIDQRWVMRLGDRVLVDQPRGAVLRSLGLNHMGHHRAQLGVYLRLLDVALPRVYGPSADEQ
jgi:uncharacterized damage-inducible protein DinB